MNLIMMAVLAGCVSKGDFELIEVQLDATRTALSARQAACVETTRDLEEQLAGLEEEIGARQLQLRTLTEHSDFLEGELESLRQERADILALQEEPDPEPKRKKPTEEEEARAALIDATADDMRDALSIRSDYRFREEQNAGRVAAARQAFEGIIEAERGELIASGPRIVLRVPVHVLFTEGQVKLSARGEVVTEQIAQGIASMPGERLRVEGHTDSRPHHTAEHNSNWELGFDWALTVQRALVGHGAQASGVASFAATMPLADDETAEGAKINRRVDFVLLPEPGLATRFDPEDTSAVPASAPADPSEPGTPDNTEDPTGSPD